MVFLLTVFVVACFSGATATVVGFGIGSLLTPLIAAHYGAATAIAAVAIPHAFATTLRFLRMKGAVDRDVLVRFGVLSAAGGIVGALGYSRLEVRSLALILGGLLVLTAIAGLSGWTQRWRPRGPLVWLLGAVSGFFGGIAGNQGGLRAAALMSFGLEPAAFVATSTAVALFVDAARTPIYLWRARDQILQLWLPIAVATVGVLVGTLVGERVLLGLSRARFRAMVSGAIGILGIWLVSDALLSK